MCVCVIDCVMCVMCECGLCECGLNTTERVYMKRDAVLLHTEIFDSKLAHVYIYIYMCVCVV